MRRVLTTWGVIIGVLFITVSLSLAGRVTIQLTENDFADRYPQINDQGDVVWRSRVDSDWKIFLYNGIKIMQLNDLSTDEGYPRINNRGEVVYNGVDISDSEIFLYNGSHTIQLTSNTRADYNPRINNNGWVVWQGSRGSNYEIFLYNGMDTIRLTDNTMDDLSARINDNGQVVWQKNMGLVPPDAEIYFYNGTDTIRLTDNSYNDLHPMINNTGDVVWEGDDGSDTEIFLYNGTDVIQLTDNTRDDSNPRINNNGDVVWEGDDGSDTEIFLYNGTDVVQLTDNTHDDSNPRINENSDVVWEGDDGSDMEIYLHDGTDIIQLTDNSYEDAAPQINDRGEVVWYSWRQSGSEIYLSFPEFQWAATYGGEDSESANSVQQTADGHYIVAGSTSSFGAGDSDVWILKCDIDGTIEWQKTYGGPAADVASLIQHTADGHYIVAGSTYSFGESHGGIWVLKLRETGTIIWQKVYGTAAGGESLCAIEQAADGGFMVAGNTTTNEGDYFLMKLNGGGDITWQKRYGGALHDRLTSCCLTADGGCIMAGDSWSFGGNKDFWVVKVDGDGKPVWQKRYGLREFFPPDHWNDNTEYSPCIQQAADGYIVAGRSDPLGVNPLLWVFTFNDSGDITWQRFYSTLKTLQVSSVLQASDAGYILTGHVYGDDFRIGHDWILKLDTGGNQIWGHEYSRWDYDFFDAVHAIIPARDDGYIAAGTTRNWKTDYSGLSDNAWVLKLDANGEIAECPAIVPLRVVLIPEEVGDDGWSVDDTDGTDGDTSLAADDTSAEIHESAAARGDGCSPPSDIPVFVHLPKTGQKTCYDINGNVIDCTNTGQDGDIQAGVTWPSPPFLTMETARSPIVSQGSCGSRMPTAPKPLAMIRTAQALASCSGHPRLTFWQPSMLASIRYAAEATATGGFQTSTNSQALFTWESQIKRPGFRGRALNRYRRGTVITGLPQQQ